MDGDYKSHSLEKQQQQNIDRSIEATWRACYKQDIFCCCYSEFLNNKHIICIINIYVIKTLKCTVEMCFLKSDMLL